MKPGLALSLLAFASCAHAPPAPPLEGAQDTTAKVSSVDPFERRLVLETPRGDVELRATDDSELVGETGIGWVSLGELRPGDDVRVAWRVDPHGGREITKLRLLPRRGEAPETEEIPPPRDDDEPVLQPAGGLSPLPVGRN